LTGKLMSQNPTVQQLFDLSGKVFLVAGGARHLGRDMSEALAESGADGVLTSRDVASANATAAEIGQATGRRVLGLSLDATDEQDIERAFAATLEQFGRLDVLVNCVGGGGGGASGASVQLEERPRAAWDSLQEANVTAPFLLCKHAAPVMQGQGGGSIINVASIAGLIGRDRRVYPPEMPPQPIDYAAAKAAVIGLTKDLAAYLGPRGVRVNALSPGGFERGQPQAFIDAYSDKTPLQRMGRDGIDLKGAVVFLASEASAYVTGHNLVVDGGFSIWQ
jgi:NAD(P)-dependent dehydrogenase (short-subunit alcohol dehydrogenase family)